jgi:hypothetical protein
VGRRGWSLSGQPLSLKGEIMQELKLANDLFENWDRKRITIRRGIRQLMPGELLMFISTDPVSKEKARDWFSAWKVSGGNILEIGGKLHLAMPVYILSTTFAILHSMDERDIIADGFRDHEDMFEQMKRFYPDLSWADKITIVKFELQADYFVCAEQDVT